MPFQLSATTWWLLLGIFVGFVIFWLIDKAFRRDGDYAAERERREITSLNGQLSELQTEITETQKKLTDRATEVKRLTTLSEDLRDSVTDQDQKITNLETALAAAREQQVKDEPVREELSMLRGQHEKLTSDLELQRRNANRLGDEAQKNRVALSDRGTRIRTLEVELKNTQEQLRSESIQHKSALNKLQSDLAVAQRKADTPSTAPAATRQASSGVMPVAAAAAALVKGSGNSDSDDTHGDAATESTRPEKIAVNDTVTPPDQPVVDSQPTPESDTIDQSVPPADDKINAEPKPESAGSSLASRYGGSSQPVEDIRTSDSVKPGLLDRLRGAFSGRRPDDPN